MDSKSDLTSASLVRGYQNVLRSPPGPARWADDLAPIGVTDWSYDFAAHLLERAGFGGTPEEIARLAAMTPVEAVAAGSGCEASESRARSAPARNRPC